MYSLNKAAVSKKIQSKRLAGGWLSDIFMKEQRHFIFPEVSDHCALHKARRKFHND